MLDATVLVYATAGAHTLSDPCRELIAAIADGYVAATTTIGVVEEVVRLRARRFPRSDAAALGRDYVELLAPLVTPTAKELEDGLRLFDEHPSLSPAGAILACCALTAGIATVVSVDGGFASVPGLTHVRPDRAGVASLL